jgi:RHS repeat-associated protein
MTSMRHPTALDWDHADRLQHCDLDGGGDVWFVYDAQGNRVRKVQVNESGTTTRERIYLGDWEVWRERTGTGVQQARETLHITDDTGRICLIETLTVDDGDVVASPTPIHRYQHGNHLGSAALELNRNAAVISYEEFHPFGTTSYAANDSSIEVSAKRYRYIGKERDEETGLYHCGARYYAAWLTRWTAADPMGLADGPNRFTYSRGNPVRWLDSSGAAAESPPLSPEERARLSDVSLESFGITDEPPPEKKPPTAQEPDRQSSKPYAPDTASSAATIQKWRQKGAADYEAGKRFEEQVRHGASFIKDLATLGFGATPVGLAVDAADTYQAASAFLRDPSLLGGIAVVAAAVGVVPVIGDAAKGLFRAGDDVVDIGADVTRASSRTESVASDATAAPSAPTQKALPAKRTASEWRNTPGTAFGADLPVITGKWLRGGVEGRIPGQIAQRLSGRKFSSFDKFREAFWQEVAADPTLASQFSKANQANMAGGHAPGAIAGQRMDGQIKFEIHHIEEVQGAGAVYDMTNMKIVTPRRHQMHSHGK